MSIPRTEGFVNNGSRRLAYDVTGSGPDLLLLHGLSGFRDRWHTLGYVEHFAKQFRVISMDFAGHGESSKPRDPQAYTVEHVLDDVTAVLDAAGAEHPIVLGFSYGGRLALHLSLRRRLEAIIALGARFGPAMSEQRCSGFAAEWERIAALKRDGKYDPNDFSPEFQEEIERNDSEALRICTRNFGDWPSLEPAQITTPTLFLVGDRDEERIQAYHEWHGEMLRNPRFTAETLPGADHAKTFFDPNVALPAVDRYLDDRMRRHPSTGSG